MVAAMQPKGMTPITEALRQAAGQLSKPDRPATIILVSDGIETCKGDPCALAKELAAKGSKLVIHTVGFGVNDAAARQLQCIAQAGGGNYYSANDRVSLSKALVRRARGGGRAETGAASARAAGASRRRRRARHVHVADIAHRGPGHHHAQARLMGEMADLSLAGAGGGDRRREGRVPRISVCASRRASIVSYGGRASITTPTCHLRGRLCFFRPDRRGCDRHRASHHAAGRHEAALRMVAARGRREGSDQHHTRHARPASAAGRALSARMAREPASIDQDDRRSRRDRARQAQRTCDQSRHPDPAGGLGSEARSTGSFWSVRTARKSAIGKRPACISRRPENTPWSIGKTNTTTAL